MVSCITASAGALAQDNRESPTNAFSCKAPSGSKAERLSTASRPHRSTGERETPSSCVWACTQEGGTTCAGEEGGGITDRTGWVRSSRPLQAPSPSRCTPSGAGTRAGTACGTPPTRRSRAPGPTARPARTPPAARPPNTATRAS